LEIPPLAKEFLATETLPCDGCAILKSQWAEVKKVQWSEKETVMLYHLNEAGYKINTGELYWQFLFMLPGDEEFHYYLNILPKVHLFLKRHSLYPKIFSDGKICKSIQLI